MEYPTFYVTFGIGTIFRGYHAAFQAADENIVRAHMNKRYGRCWSSIYTEQPRSSKPLQLTPEVLAYSRWEDAA